MTARVSKLVGIMNAVRCRYMYTVYYRKYLHKLHIQCFDCRGWNPVKRLF